MSDMFKPGQIIQTQPDRFRYEIEELLGSGTQGEVYKVKHDNKYMALKWYYPQHLFINDGLHKRLERIVEHQSPTNRFLWPMSLVSVPGMQTFGYVMTLREARFKSMVDFLKGRVDPSFRTLAIVGLELAHNFWKLHSQGFCYRDISPNNIFFDPNTGEIRICDNDNVDVNYQDGPINGTPRFMAPELVRGDAKPSKHTDLFSLAVLLFHLLMVHHPLFGEKELEFHSLDLISLRFLCGENPIFIFDPHNNINRPVPGHQDNAIVFWKIYPQFLRDRFTMAFTAGLYHSGRSRVMETVWRGDMARLHDAIVDCAYCKAENFYDSDAHLVSGNPPGRCWHCDKVIQLPPRLHIGKRVTVLNPGTQLFRHHLNNQQEYDFSHPIAEVTHHPHLPDLWGIKNLSNLKWVGSMPNGAMFDILPGQHVPIENRTRISFGKVDGEIRT